MVEPKPDKAVPLGRYVVFFAIAILGCAADLATKAWVFAWLGPPDRFNPRVYWLIPNVFGLETSLNQGALFGIGQGQVPLFAALSLVALVGIIAWLFYGRAALDRLLNVALALISAGILGNLYDRLGLPGLINAKTGETLHAVRDWILAVIFGWHWPNFNIADSLLVCGAVLLAWHTLRYQPPAQSAASQD